MKGDFDLYETDPMAHLRAPKNRSREAIGRLINGEFDVKPLPNGDFEVTTSPIPPHHRRPFVDPVERAKVDAMTPPGAVRLDGSLVVEDAMAFRQAQYEAKLGKPDKVQAAIAAAQRHAADKENPDNPKDKFGAAKPCLSYFPPVALMHEAVVMKLGADKYGPFNWRTKPVKAKTYVDAAIRHLLQWADGEELDEQSRASHLAHARACCGILIDAQTQGNLIDDRHKSGGLTAIIDSLTERM